MGVPSSEKTVIFEPRYALPRTVNPDLGWLRDVILGSSAVGGEFGEATLSVEIGGRRVTMVLIADRELGYYLTIGPHEWLSLGDRSRLSEVVCPDDWNASAGLFVPPEKAWLAIEGFCQSGTRSAAIEWITPDEVPAGGNY